MKGTEQMEKLLRQKQLVKSGMNKEDYELAYEDTIKMLEENNLNVIQTMFYKRLEAELSEILFGQTI